jgi:hypothetical protein
VVMGACSLTAWDEPSAESYFSDLLLGGILWMFLQAHKRWASMLGLDCQGLSSANEK